MLHKEDTISTQTWHRQISPTLKAHIKAQTERYKFDNLNQMSFPQIAQELANQIKEGIWNDDTPPEYNDIASQYIADRETFLCMKFVAQNGLDAVHSLWHELQTTYK